MGGLTVASLYDELLRRTSVALNSTSLLVSNSYGYALDSGRLFHVSDGTRTVTYGYVDNSPLVGSISYGGYGALAISKEYDNLNRLTHIATVWGVTNAFDYQLNAAGRLPSGNRTTLFH